MVASVIFHRVEHFYRTGDAAQSGMLKQLFTILVQ